VSAATLHIVVDVHVDGDQILGQADDGVTKPKPFSGWLGLIGALDGLVRVQPKQGPTVNAASDKTTSDRTTTEATHIMTIHEALIADLPTVTFDLYRDIHKGIRAELFAVTATAGSIDPSDRVDAAELADHVRSVAELLELHAHHEDEAIDPSLEAHLPALAERISADHLLLNRQIDTLVDMASSAEEAPAPGRRRLVRQVYLDLASFVSSYLEHQDLEERVVMPALEQAIGVDAVIGIHGAILGSIPPDVLMRSLALMLPAMNVDDRSELLGGMQASAPPEAFAAVLGLAESVLRPADFAATSARIA